MKDRKKLKNPSPIGTQEGSVSNPPGFKNEPSEEKSPAEKEREQQKRKENREKGLE